MRLPAGPLRPSAGRAAAGLAGWRWPLPALATWALAWLLASLMLAQGVARGAAVGAGAALAVAAAALWPGLGPWRRGLLGLGFPLAALASGLAAGVPAWAWLLPLAVLLAAYPMAAWRDAPLFPTPADALAGLAGQLPLAPGDRVLDAGCGLGHGLRALRRQWPAAELHGVEWSRPLALAAGWRCRDARVLRADMWRHGWGGYRVVYLFQRPESMARAWAKARAEMAAGSWLVSLDFEVPDTPASAVLRRPGAQPVWLYRVPQAAADAAPAGAPAQYGAPAADIPPRPRAGFGRA